MSQKVKYFGQVGMLKEGMVEEYIRLHADPWPDVVKMIQKCNLTNYSIFIQGRMVFSYFEYIGDNYAVDMKKMEEDPVTQQWWEHTHPCFEKYAFNRNSPYYHDMEQIFYVD